MTLVVLFVCAIENASYFCTPFEKEETNLTGSIASSSVTLRRTGSFTKALLDYYKTLTNRAYSFLLCFTTADRQLHKSLVRLLLRH